MKKIKYYFEKYKLIMYIIICLIILITLIILAPKKEKKSDIVVNEIKEEKNILEEENEILEEIKVDIKGLVEKPGVYQMDSNSRVIDVINKAGGLKENSNTEYINLSKKLKDEMIIIIYSNDEVEKFKQEDKEIIYIEYECICPDNINDSCINESDTVNTNGISTSEEDELISINSDDIDELTKLDGIGESKAKKIIEYRKEFGDFKTLEDIMNVPGIGDSAYSKIKDYIKL